ncbi:unnamed protein product [Durusdinium trenchii]|uniref:Autophagy-related protein 9 n=1 Tax=Durusdinium trenchii TaxID=1381693 RepID=A0ABP0KC11_9DINO
MYQPLSDGLPPIATNGSDAPQDLQKFLDGFYRYFEAKGFLGIIALNISHITALTFTIVFSFVLLFSIDWESLMTCDSEESCQAVSIWYSWEWHTLGLRRWGVLVCTALFGLYWGVNVVQSLSACMQASQMRSFYKDQLGILSDESLETMLWSEVVSRLVQRQKESRLCIVQEELTALEITNIIMRQDNFIIGLTNHHAFTKNLWPCFPRRLVYTNAPFRNILLAVFPPVIVPALDHRGRLREEFLAKPEVLAGLFKIFAVVNLILLPPLLVFVAIYFFLRHAQEFRSQRTSPFRKQWSDYAFWTFREYNELPHQISARMSAAQTAAEAYVHTTRPTSPVLKSLLRTVKFISGSILAALLLVALWDDTPLLFVKIQEKNLLWYLALFGFVFAVVDSAEENAGDTEGKGSGSEACLHAPSIPLRMYIALMKLVSCTHYLPASWRSPARLTSLAGACSGLRRASLCKHFRRVRQELLCDFLLHRIQALAEELLGVLVNPILLWCCLAPSASEIISIMRALQHSTPCLGDWCVYGCLDPALCSGFSVSSDERRELLSLEREKLEKSALSFLLNHQLLWSPDDSINQDIMLPEHSCDFRGNNYLPPSFTMQQSLQLQDFTKHCDGTAVGTELETAEWHADGPPDSRVHLSAASLEPEFGAKDERVWHAEGSSYPDRPTRSSNDEDFVLTHILGTPQTALSLLLQVQQFQQRAMSVDDNPTGENYTLLPSELVSVPPIKRGASADEIIADAAKKGLEEQKQDTLDMFGALFFWLEALRQFRGTLDETSEGGVFSRQSWPQQ